MWIVGWTFLAIGSFAVMELVSYLMHRFLLHGPLWFLHASHHEPRRGVFERNDFISLFFSLLSIAMFASGAFVPGWRILLPIAIGVTAYGMAYFFLHDMLAHGRLIRVRKPAAWMSYLREAHSEHHRSDAKVGREPFGLLYVPTLTREELREPTGR
jgi:beta-carotene 3-hydroxylase